MGRASDRPNAIIVISKSDAEVGEAIGLATQLKAESYTIFTIGVDGADLSSLSSSDSTNFNAATPTDTAGLQSAAQAIGNQLVAMAPYCPPAGITSSTVTPPTSSSSTPPTSTSSTTLPPTSSTSTVTPPASTSSSTSTASTSTSQRTTQSTTLSTSPTTVSSGCPGSLAIKAGLILLFDYTTIDGSLAETTSIEQFISYVLFTYPGNYYQLTPEIADYVTILNIVPYPNSNSFIDIAANPVTSAGSLTQVISSINSFNPGTRPNIQEGLQFVRTSMGRAPDRPNAIIIISKSDAEVGEAIGLATQLKAESYTIFTIGVDGADLSSLSSSDSTNFNVVTPDDTAGLLSAAQSIGNQLVAIAPYCPSTGTTSSSVTPPTSSSSTVTPPTSTSSTTLPPTSSTSTVTPPTSTSSSTSTASTSTSTRTTQSTTLSTSPTTVSSGCPGSLAIKAGLILLFDYTTVDGSLAETTSIENFISNFLFTYTGNYYQLTPDTDYVTLLYIVPYPNSDTFINIAANPVTSAGSLTQVMLSINSLNPGTRPSIQEGLQFVRTNIGRRSDRPNAIIIISKSDDEVGLAMDLADQFKAESYTIFTIGVDGADLSFLASSDSTNFNVARSDDTAGLLSAAQSIGNQLVAAAPYCPGGGSSSSTMTPPTSSSTYSSSTSSTSTSSTSRSTSSTIQSTSSPSTTTASTTTTVTSSSSTTNPSCQGSIVIKQDVFLLFDYTSIDGDLTETMNVEHFIQNVLFTYSGNQYSIPYDEASDGFITRLNIIPYPNSINFDDIAANPIADPAHIRGALATINTHPAATLSDIQDGLQYVISMGRRNGVAHSVILISKSDAFAGDATDAANRLKALGITIYTIGMDGADLSSLASNGAANFNLVSTTDDAALLAAAQSIGSQLVATSPYCLPGGTTASTLTPPTSTPSTPPTSSPSTTASTSSPSTSPSTTTVTPPTSISSSTSTSTTTSSSSSTTTVNAPTGMCVLEDILVLFDYVRDSNDPNNNGLTETLAIENFISTVLMSYPGNPYYLGYDFATGGYVSRLNLLPYPNTEQVYPDAQNPIESVDAIADAMTQINLVTNPSTQADINNGLMYVQSSIGRRANLRTLIIIAKSDVFVSDAVSAARQLWNDYTIYTIGVDGADLSSLASRPETALTAASPTDTAGLLAAAQTIGNGMLAEASVPCPAA